MASVSSALAGAEAALSRAAYTACTAGAAGALGELERAAREAADACEAAELAAGALPQQAGLSGAGGDVLAAGVLCCVAAGEVQAALFAVQRAKVAGEGARRGELARAEAVARALHERGSADLAAFFAAAAAQPAWPPLCEAARALAVAAVRERQLLLLPRLFGQAVPEGKLAAYLGLPPGAAVALARSRGWTQSAKAPGAVLAPGDGTGDGVDMAQIKRLADTVVLLERKLTTNVAEVLNEAKTKGHAAADLTTTPPAPGPVSVSTARSRPSRSNQHSALA
jgi:hypothetical protein